MPNSSAWLSEMTQFEEGLNRIDSEMKGSRLVL
jgi:hypothetical protein